MCASHRLHATHAGTKPWEPLSTPCLYLSLCLRFHSLINLRYTQATCYTCWDQTLVTPFYSCLYLSLCLRFHSLINVRYTQVTRDTCWDQTLGTLSAACLPFSLSPLSLTNKCALYTQATCDTCWDQTLQNPFLLHAFPFICLSLSIFLFFYLFHSTCLQTFSFYLSQSVH